MKTFKQYLEQNDFFDDELDATREKIRKRGKAVKTELKTEPYSLTLYHGSKADLESIEKGSNYVLDPNQSEQGLIWFTHEFINGYNPLEYAKGHGNWVLEYPLQTKKHFTEVHYEDGTIEQKAPDEIMDKIDTTKNCRFMCSFGSMFSGGYCIELPEGWYFTYKHEKFIGTSNPVVFSQGMIL